MPWNETSGRREVVPRISELGWINDASARTPPLPLLNFHQQAMRLDKLEGL